MSGKSTAMCEKSAVDQNLQFFNLVVDTLLGLISRGVRKFRTKNKPCAHHFSVLLSGGRSLKYPVIKVNRFQNVSHTGYCLLCSLKGKIYGKKKLRNTAMFPSFITPEGVYQ